MAKRGKDESKPLPRDMRHMQRNVPLNGVRGWQRKKLAVAHADHWPYGALDFSQTPERQFSTVASNHVAPSSSQAPSAPVGATSPNPLTHDRASHGISMMDSQRGSLSTSNTRVDRRGARPRRRGAARTRRVSSPAPEASNTTRSSYSQSDTMETASYPRITPSDALYAGIAEHLNYGSNIQGRYTSHEMNADIIPRSSIPNSMSSFESGYIPLHDLFNSPQNAEHSSAGLMSSYYSTPNETLSNSHFDRQLAYPDATGYSLMMNTSLPVQCPESISSSSLSDSSAGEPCRNWRRAGYDLRTRVDSQPSIAHAITANPSNVLQQGLITANNLNNPSFHAAEYHYPSSLSSSASTTSSPLDPISSTSYVPSGEHITHGLADISLQVRSYPGDIDLQHLTLAQNSFPPYSLPDGIPGTDRVFNTYDRTIRRG